MDINPFLAFPDADRCAAVDARFRVEPADAEDEDA